MLSEMIEATDILRQDSVVRGAVPRACVEVPGVTVAAYASRPRELTPRIKSQYRRWMVVLIPLIFLGPSTLAAQATSELIEKYRQALTDTAAACTEVKAALSTVATALDDEARRQSALSARLGGSFSGDESGDSKLYRFGANISLSRGQYPGELRFTSGVGVTLRNGNFQEDVSRFHLSYDYHPSEPLQFYTFVSRSSDNFMSIDQRYEIGAGVIVEELVGLTGQGNSTRRLLGQFSFRHPVSSDAGGTGQQQRQQPAEGATEAPQGEEGEGPGWDDWKRCMPKDSAEVDSTEAELLERAQTTAEIANRKRYRQLRVGLLLGMFAELENASISTTEAEFSPPGTQRIRWELRPTLRIQPRDGLEFSLYPYFKLPMFGQWRAAVPISQTDTARVFDYRVDLDATLSVSLSSGDIGQTTGGVTLDVTFHLAYDRVPPRIPDNVNTVEFDPVIAQRSHRRFTFGISVTL